MLGYSVMNKGYTTECWIWLGCKRGGYGQVSNPRYPQEPSKMIGAHVYYWEKINGRVPNGMVLDHLCNVRDCVNPAHLKICTHKENIRKGKVPIITKAAADDIRQLLDSGFKQRDIARMYGISIPTVSQIKRGVTWNE